MRIRHGRQIARLMMIVMVGLISVRTLAQRQTTTQDQQTTTNTPSLTKEQLQKLNDQVVQLCGEKKYEEALAVLLTILTDNPRDSFALYNAACIQAQLGQKDKSVALLHEAVLKGFVDFEHMKRDPDLDPIRDMDDYKALLEAIESAYGNAADYAEAWSRAILGEEAIIQRDDEYHFVYATNLTQPAFDRMLTTIQTQFQYQIKSFFNQPPTAYVLLLVPSPEKADQLIQSVRVGGFYDHDTRRLVTRDLGPSLQHELTHSLHHAHMDRLGQTHPMWIQEGLASIFEMYEIDNTGQLTVLDNSRLNIAINLRRAGALSKWKKLFTSDDRKFTSSRPRAKYAEARAIFQFVSETAPGGLAVWYKAYIETYEKDPTGITAFEKVYDDQLETIERQYRQWLTTKEKVPEYVRNDEPSIGVRVADQIANDGVAIVSINQRGAAQSAGLRPHDVILTIDGQPVYAAEQLVYAVLKHREGDEVTLTVRNGTREREVKVKLQPIQKHRGHEELPGPGISV